MGRLAPRVFHAIRTFLHVSYDSHAIVRMFRMPRKFCMTHIANRRLNVMRRADGDGNN